jgi:hypothetical protein
MNSTPAPSVAETAPAETVAGYYGPGPMDPSAIKGIKITPEEKKR